MIEYLKTKKSIYTKMKLCSKYNSCIICKLWLYVIKFLNKINLISNNIDFYNILICHFIY